MFWGDQLQGKRKVGPGHGQPVEREDIVWGNGEKIRKILRGWLVDRVVLSSASSPVMDRLG